MESIEHQITLVEGKETKSLKHNHIVVMYFLVNYWNIDCWEPAEIVGKGFLSNNAMAQIGSPNSR
jgi:hypothetical protein